LKALYGYNTVNFLLLNLDTTFLQLMIIKVGTMEALQVKKVQTKVFLPLLLLLLSIAMPYFRNFAYSNTNRNLTVNFSSSSSSSSILKNKSIQVSLLHPLRKEDVWPFQNNRVILLYKKTSRFVLGVVLVIVQNGDEVQMAIKREFYIPFFFFFFFFGKRVFIFFY
jgi:hypothetical protein